MLAIAIRCYAGWDGGAQVLDDEQLSEMLMRELDVDGDGEISCEEVVYQSQRTL